MTANTEILIAISLAQEKLIPPFQPMWAASSTAGILLIDFGVDRAAFTQLVQKRFPRAEIVLSHAPHPALAQIGEYLNGQRRSFSVPLDLGPFTDFQRQVYRAVIAIPYGETRSYGQIAKLIAGKQSAQLGKQAAARAVGAANGANPLPILIPCHRLVGADGSLRGYGGAGGIRTKQWLLDLEKNTTLT